MKNILMPVPRDSINWTLCAREFINEYRILLSNRVLSDNQRTCNTISDVPDGLTHLGKGRSILKVLKILNG